MLCLSSRLACKRLSCQQPVVSANKGCHAEKHSLSCTGLSASELELAGTACKAAQRQLPAGCTGAYCWTGQRSPLPASPITCFPLSGADMCSAADLCPSIDDPLAHTAQPHVACQHLVNDCLRKIPPAFCRAVLPPRPAGRWAGHPGAGLRVGVHVPVRSCQVPWQPGHSCVQQQDPEEVH